MSTKNSSVNTDRLSQGKTSAATKSDSTRGKPQQTSPPTSNGLRPSGSRLTADNAKLTMENLLRAMTKTDDCGSAGTSFRATDLHINPGRSPDYRVEKAIRSLKGNRLSQEDVELLSDVLMSETQRERFGRNHCIDLSYNLDKVRFRVNIVQSFSGRSISIRKFEEIRSFDDYHLPQNYLRIADDARGFVIMSGSTGSGKTTSIAAMLDYINKTYHKKIVTIEDPVEYVYEPKKSIIVQIEIGEEGIPNEDAALRNLVRMDPDAGLAGEMRDKESLEAALKTAQAGHLIFGTLHCEGVAQAFERILAYYDTTERERILGTLSDNLAAIINQRLLPCVKEGIDIVPAYEIFIPNPLTRRYIRELKYTEAVAEMEKPAMKDIGCVTYVDSLHKLVVEEWVDYSVALEQAGDQAERLKARLKGIALR